jgi:hypothetical protein
MPTAFETFLADPSIERVWLLEIDAFPLAAMDDGTGATGHVQRERIQRGRVLGGRRSAVRVDALLLLAWLHLAARRSAGGPYYDARLDPRRRRDHDRAEASSAATASPASRARSPTYRS